MVWSRRVEDMIYHVFYMYGCSSDAEQMATLKAICMSEINSIDGLKEELKEDESLKHFVIQTALKNIGAERYHMRNKIKSAMKDMLQRNCACDYTFAQNGKEIYQKNMYALDAYMTAYDMAKSGNVACYMTPDGVKALNPVFIVIDGVAYLSGQKI